MTGATIAQAVPFLAMPLLTRLYQPDDFGEVAIFIQVAQLLVVFATGRYDQAIQLPRSHEHGGQLFALSRLFTWVISGTTLVVIAAIWSFTSIAVSHIYWLLPVLVFAMSGVQQETQWLMRHKEFTKIGTSKVGFVSASVPTRIAAGYLKLGSLGLVAGTLLGNLVSWAFLAWNGSKIRSGIEYSRAKMKVLAIEHKDFPIINSFHAMSDMSRELAMLFLIGAYFGQTALGWYAVAFRIVRAPMMLIGAAIGQIFYQRASEQFASGGEIHSITVKTMKLLLFVGIPLFAMLAALGQNGFEFILGSEYGEVGRVVRIMTPWLFLHLISSSLSQIPFILKEQKFFFKLGLAGNILQVLAIAVGPYLFGQGEFYSTLWLLTGAGVLFMVTFLFMINSKTKRFNT